MANYLWDTTLDKIRILMGDEATARTRQAIFEGLCKNVCQKLDDSLEHEKEANDLLTSAAAMGYVESVVEDFNAEWRSSHGQPGPTMQMVTRSWYNPNLDSRWSMVPSLTGTLTMMGTLMLTAMSVAREREQGTFDQLLVTPFRPFEILIGKAVPNMVIGLAQATTILVIAQFWFHIPFVGSFVVLYAGLTPFLMAAVGLGLFVSSIAATMQQAMLFAFILILPFALLSGPTTPVNSMPKFLQSVMVINPLLYSLDLTKRVYLEGAGFAQLLSDFLPLAVIGLVTLSGAAWLLRRQLT